jgi:hypothetical protein
MPSSTRSIFSEPSRYQSALRRDGGFELTVTGSGNFKAELTRIELSRMLLTAGMENLSRIGFIKVPHRQVRVLLPPQSGTALMSAAFVSSGILLRAGEIIIQGPGQRLHERTDGPYHWRTLSLPPHDLLRYGRAMIGPTFNIPTEFCQWRPPRRALGRLSHLHDDAVRMTKVRPDVVAGTESTRGLEQELIDALMECLATGPVMPSAPMIRRYQTIMAQFEDQIIARRRDPQGLAEICASLGITQRVLRSCCQMHVGMSPTSYLRLRDGWQAAA